MLTFTTFKNVRIIANFILNSAVSLGSSSLLFSHTQVSLAQSPASPNVSENCRQVPVRFAENRVGGKWSNWTCRFIEGEQYHVDCMQDIANKEEDLNDNHTGFCRYFRHTYASKTDYIHEGSAIGLDLRLKAHGGNGYAANRCKWDQIDPPFSKDPGFFERYNNFNDDHQVNANGYSEKGSFSRWYFEGTDYSEWDDHGRPTKADYTQVIEDYANQSSRRKTGTMKIFYNEVYFKTILYIEDIGTNVLTYDSHNNLLGIKEFRGPNELGHEIRILEYKTVCN